VDGFADTVGVALELLVPDTELNALDVAVVDTVGVTLALDVADVVALPVYVCRDVKLVRDDDVGDRVTVADRVAVADEEGVSDA
jgi:hypothetical protein